MMNHSTLDNNRAQYAFKMVEKASATPRKDNYLRYCKKAPSMIKVNGFGLTMAYLYSKEESKALFQDIAVWLNMQIVKGGESCSGEKIEAKDFLQDITNSNSSCYRQMSKEAMALLVWLKRFAEGLIK